MIEAKYGRHMAFLATLKSFLFNRTLLSCSAKVLAISSEFVAQKINQNTTRIELFLTASSSNGQALFLRSGHSINWDNEMNFEFVKW